MCLTNIKSNNSRFDWNPSSYKCEYKTKAALLTEGYEEIIDNKTWLIKKHIKTVSIKKDISIDSWKPFATSSILFLAVSVILIGLFIYFYVNS